MNEHDAAYWRARIAAAPVIGATGYAVERSNEPGETMTEGVTCGKHPNKATHMRLHPTEGWVACCNTCALDAHARGVPIRLLSSTAKQTSAPAQLPPEYLHRARQVADANRIVTWCAILFGVTLFLYLLWRVGFWLFQ